MAVCGSITATEFIAAVPGPLRMTWQHHAVLAAALMLAGGCDSSRADRSPQPTSEPATPAVFTVVGTVTVFRASGPIIPLPYPADATVTIRNTADRLVARVRSNGKAGFHVVLPVGTFRVEATMPDATCPPVTVVVAGGVAPDPVHLECKASSIGD